MNFKRGMFRVWVVVSLLWVIAVAVFFFNPVKAAFEVQDFSGVGIRVEALAKSMAAAGQGAPYPDRRTGPVARDRACNGLDISGFQACLGPPGESRCISSAEATSNPSAEGQTPTFLPN